MRKIGIDFDNTIVSYDEVFYKHALEENLIGPHVAMKKNAVRDAVRILPDGNTRWTELQGTVYGRFMPEASLMPGVERFLDQCRRHSVRVSVISHKTLFPFMGPRVNLHDAARRWLSENGFVTRFGLSENDIVFEESLDGKLARIGQKGCDFFIDDLPEVLTHPAFPSGVQKILFGRTAGPDIKGFGDWDEISEYFFR